MVNRLHFSPKELGQAIGISESSLKRWIDAGKIHAFKTAGGHRRISQNEAIRVIREAKLNVVEPQKIGLDEIGDIQTDDREETQHTLTQALLDGDHKRVRGTILSLYINGNSIAEICDAHVSTAMTHIGRLWKHDTKGIYIEHRATAIAVQALGQLNLVLPPPPENAPLAVGAAPSGDPYILPSLAASLTLTSIGWKAVNLGPETPPETLNTAAFDSNASLVWLSISGNLNEQQIAKSIRDLQPPLHKANRTLVFGGRAIQNPFPYLDDNTHHIRSMAELEGFAKAALNTLSQNIK